MKCDKLKEYKAYEFGTSYVYDIGEVNEAIAELKAEKDRLKCELDLWRDGNIIREETLNEIESLKASHYAEMVDAGMRERRLRRALYKACANWAHHRVFVRFKTNEKAWENVERKCRAKAEQYK